MFELDITLASEAWSCSIGDVSDGLREDQAMPPRLKTVAFGTSTNEKSFCG
jgi:hypothetical protein